MSGNVTQLASHETKTCTTPGPKSQGTEHSLSLIVYLLDLNSGFTSNLFCY